METGEHTRVGTETEVAVADKLAIFVLGMHRSGTSALAGMLGALGVAMPQMLMASHPTNPKGFFESYAIMDASEHMLAAAGSSWDDWRAVDFSRIAGVYEEPVADVLHNEFGEASPICIKDPRHCRLAPIWFSVAQHIGYRIAVLLPFRHPLEVAYSLHLRDGLPISQALLIWLRHAVDAEYHSRHFPRSFVYLPELLDDWQATVERIGAELQLAWPTAPLDAAPAVAEFLDRDLKNHTVSEEVIGEDPLLNGWVRLTFEAYKTLASNPSDPDAMAVLGGVRNDLDQAGVLFGVAFDDMRRKVREDFEIEHQATIAESTELKERTAAQAASLQELNARAARVEEVRRQRDDARTRIEAQEKVIGQLQGYLKTVTEVSAAQSKVLAVAEEDRGRLRETIAALEADGRTLRDGVAEVEKQRDALRTDIRFMEAERERHRSSAIELQRKLDAMERQVDGMEARSLEDTAEISRQRAALDDCKVKFIKYETRIASSAARLSELDKRLVETRRLLAISQENYQQAVIRHDQQLEQARQDIADQAEESRKAIEGLKSQIWMLRAEMHQAETLLRSYREGGGMKYVRWALGLEAKP